MKFMFLSAAACCAAAFASAASAQIPLELLQGGGNQGERYSEAFYKGPEGFWVLMRNKANDGYGCSVNFITADSLFALHGPLNADQRQPDGMIMFQGPSIPSPKKPNNVHVLLRSNDPEANYPMTNIRLQDNGGTYIMGMPVKEMLKQKHDTETITLVYQGTQVFQLPVIRMSAALKQLEQCINKGNGAPKKK